MKGRQRKYVFVVGFDNSYLKYYARGLPRDICPNTLYVAATRATHGLYLLETAGYSNNRPLDFLKMNHIEMKQCDYITFKGNHQSIFPDDDEADEQFVNLIKKHIITPTELVRFISESVIENISPIIDRIFVKESDNTIVLDIPTVIETKKGFFEEVSDLNGIAIPCMYYDYLKDLWAVDKTDENIENLTNQNILFDIIHNSIENMRSNDHIYLKQIVNDLPKRIETIEDYLYIANVSIAAQELLYFKLKQIDRDEYNWLTEEMVIACKERLRAVVGPDCQNQMPQVENTIIHESEDEPHKNIDKFLSGIFGSVRQFRFTARVDLITESVVWELKCTSEITIEHLVQVIAYAWLWNMRYNEHCETPVKVFKIFNIKTGDVLRLDASMEDLNYIMTQLLIGKYAEIIPKSEEEFLADCHNILG